MTQKMRVFYTTFAVAAVLVFSVVAALLLIDAVGDELSGERKHAQNKQEIYTRDYANFVSDSSKSEKTKKGFRAKWHDAQDLVDTENGIASAFFYSKQTRIDSPETWSIEYEIYQVNPGQEKGRKAGKISAVKGVYDSIWINEGEVYTYNVNKADALERVDSSGVFAFIDFGADRRISDIFSGKDKRWYIARYDTRGAKSAHDSELLIYDESGVLIKSFSLKEGESPLYAHFKILGVDYSASVVHLKEIGGDAGALWGKWYALSLDNGKVSLVGDISVVADKSGNSGLPVELSPSGQSVLIIKDGKLFARRLQGGARDISFGSNARSAFFVDDNAVLWSDENSVYRTDLTDISTKRIANTVLGHTLLHSANRRYAFIKRNPSASSAKSDASDEWLVVDVVSGKLLRKISLPKRRIYGTARYGETYTSVSYTAMQIR